jgi:hypothetical protein
MRARFLVKGLIARTNDLMIYGDITEGGLRAGMRIGIPLDASRTILEPICSIDFLDDVAGEGTTCVGLALVPAAEHRELWSTLALDGEVLEVVDEERRVDR